MKKIVFVFIEIIQLWSNQMKVFLGSKSNFKYDLKKQTKKTTTINQTHVMFFLKPKFCAAPNIPGCHTHLAQWEAGSHWHREQPISGLLRSRGMVHWNGAAEHSWGPVLLWDPCGTQSVSHSRSSQELQRQPAASSRGLLGRSGSDRETRCRDNAQAPECDTGAVDEDKVQRQNRDKVTNGAAGDTVDEISRGKNLKKDNERDWQRGPDVPGHIFLIFTAWCQSTHGFSRPLPPGVLHLPLRHRVSTFTEVCAGELSECQVYN